MTYLPKDAIFAVISGTFAAVALADNCWLSARSIKDGDSGGRVDTLDGASTLSGKFEVAAWRFFS